MKNTPLETFQSLCRPQMEELANAVSAPWFRESTTYALSHMAISGASKEELAGAERFVDALQKLSEIKQPMPTLPDKSRLASYENLSVEEQKRLLKLQEELG